MKIVIKEKEGRRFTFPIPYHLCVNLAVREAWFRMALTYGSQLKEAERTKYLSYLEAVDFGALRMALKTLSSKRGLTLVEVSSTDGTYFKVST